MMYMILAAILCANAYVFYRFWHMLPAVGAVRWLLVVFTVVAVLSPFAAIGLEAVMPQRLAGFLYKFGTSWLFFMIYFFMLFLLLDVARLFGAPLGGFMHGSWTGFAVSVAVVTLVIVAGNITYFNKKRVELPIVLDKHVRYGGGLRIVAVSDLHIGHTIGRRELGKWVGLINAENPDVVLIAGDITDKRAGCLSGEGFAEEFRKLRPRLGVYASLGNHEYINDVDESIAFLEESGIRVLRDEAALVDSAFYIIGRDDLHNRNRLPLDTLAAQLDRSKPVILLDHQPYGLEQAPENGVDLQFSGHTHRGQVWPLSWITDRMYERSYGYLKKDGTHIYVSSGLGIWGGKYRIGTRSEYVVITLDGVK